MQLSLRQDKGISHYRNGYGVETFQELSRKSCTVLVFVQRENSVMSLDNFYKYIYLSRFERTFWVLKLQ